VLAVNNMQTNMQQFYIIRGLPGSGKSTLAQQLVNAGIVTNYYEADQYFVRDGQYQFDRSKISDAHDWCQLQVHQALEAKNNVAVSNTFTTCRELEPYFEMARYFSIKPTVLLCQSNWGSIHNVPEQTLQRMKSRFQYNIDHLF
jgi:predicted ATPase